MTFSQAEKSLGNGTYNLGGELRRTVLPKASHCSSGFESVCASDEGSETVFITCWQPEEDILKPLETSPKGSVKLENMPFFDSSHALCDYERRNGFKGNNTEEMMMCFCYK